MKYASYLSKFRFLLKLPRLCQRCPTGRKEEHHETRHRVRIRGLFVGRLCGLYRTVLRIFRILLPASRRYDLPSGGRQRSSRSVSPASPSPPRPPSRRIPALSGIFPSFRPVHRRSDLRPPLIFSESRYTPAFTRNPFFHDPQIRTPFSCRKPRETQIRRRVRRRRRLRLSPHVLAARP